MDTPKRMTLAQTQTKIAEFFILRCRQISPAGLTCTKCGGEIRRVRAFMCLHDDKFGEECMGPGRAWRMEIPYCAGCEEPPSLYGCVHMSEAELNLPSVIEASRPFPANRAKTVWAESDN